jgi:hypothetical protein
MVALPLRAAKGRQGPYRCGMAQTAGPFQSLCRLSVTNPRVKEHLGAGMMPKLTPDVLFMAGEGSLLSKVSKARAGAPIFVRNLHPEIWARRQL